jgi:hypothetical protein
MTDLSLPKTVKISDNVLFQQINDECVLLNMESEQYFGLDDVGSRIWEILSENGDTETALKVLLAEYDTDEETLKRDLSVLLTNLEHEKLILFEN